MHYRPEYFAPATAALAATVGAERVLVVVSHDGLPAAMDAVVRRLAAALPGGADRVISDCHFPVQLNHFIPRFLSYSVPVFLK